MPLPISQTKAQFAAYAGLVVGVFFGLWVISGLDGPKTARVVSDAAFVLFAVFAGGCAIAAARASRGRERMAWTFVSVGIGGWLFGDVVKSFLPLLTGEAVPFPSIADVGYLTLPIATCLAMVMMPIGHSGFSAARLLMDGVIVAGSLFLISWILVLRDLFATGATDMFPFAVVLAYPILDLVVVTVGILMLIRARGPARAPVAFLLAGIVLMAVSNDVYLHASSNYARGDLLDIGWATSMLMFAFAALARFRVPQADLRAPEVSPWLPYLTLALAGVVSVGDLFNPVSAIVLVLALGMVIAVMFRQFLVVGENQRLLAIVADQALRDPLTGVANRFLFHDRLTHAVAVHSRGAGPLALLSLDLDDFKLVNDGLGHPAGDALLMQVADRILTSVRAGDTVARLGGDEFAILIEQGPDRPELVAQRVVEAFDEPFVVDGHVLFIRPSVGLSIAPADAPDLCADTLLKQSDAAMYAAKRTRTSEVHTFAPDMNPGHLDELELQRQRNAANGSGGFGIRILGELRRAIEHGDLDLAYQPQIQHGTGEIVGVEALVRWPHPERGLLEPASFLPIVRRNGLMHALTELVLDKALADAAEWHARGSSVLVAVNLFAPTLSDVDLPRRISDVLARHGLASSALTLEITEDLVLQDFQRTRMVLQQLRDCGTRMSIDDFGSGYSGLNYLRELPIDEVKLDREFIAPILADARAASIVRAVIDLAHELQVTCVAEGVESAEIAHRLREFGCEVAQGFHYSPAVTAPVLFGMLSGPTALMAGQQ